VFQGHKLGNTLGGYPVHCKTYTQLIPQVFCGAWVKGTVVHCITILWSVNIFVVVVFDFEVCFGSLFSRGNLTTAQFRLPNKVSQCFDLVFGAF